MIEDIEKITEDTNLGNVKGDSIRLRNNYPHIRDIILQKQERITDLEKRIKGLVALVRELHDIDPKNEDLQEIFNYVDACFGDIEVEK